MKVNYGKQLFGWKSSDPLPEHSYLFPAIVQLLPESNNLTILDVGCGNGYMAGQLSAMGHKVIGIDLAEDGISIARNAYPHLRFELWSAYDNFLKVTGSSVDLVISSEVIEHLYSPQRFLQNVYSILKPGGYVILSTPYHGYLKNLALSIFNSWDKHHTVVRVGGHIKFFSIHTLQTMLEENGFINGRFNNAGRVRWLWKSIVCSFQKGEKTHD